MDDRQRNLNLYDSAPEALMPPATIDETGWDILLALRSDERHDLGLDKLASLISVPLTVLTRWLVTLEQGDLIFGARHKSTRELHAVLTPGGRDLLNRYLSASADLQLRAH